jgi:NAD(P)-dependent dehydrogenase (short-subunit alcohol dehydrogenase family)
MQLDGAGVLVTGGASGLGEATVRALVEQGARVLIFDRNEERATSLAAELEASYAVGDVANADDVTAAVQYINQIAPLRGLVNCAGIPRGIRTIGRNGAIESAHPLEQFERVVRVNLTGTFNCIRLAASLISQQPIDADGERGAIVNTASIAAFDGQVGQAAYAASKGGVIAMTLAIARDLAPAAIRVNTIAPGAFETPIMGSPESAASFHEHLEPTILFPKRFGRPAEFASFALGLLQNPYINAETIRLDAGQRMTPK